MAGESPDKSERERSSGETTENPGKVPSARQDPAEPAEPDGAGGTDGTRGAGGAARDARLRAAVAAWVAADGTGAADGAEEDDEGETAEASAPEDDEEPAATSDLPVRRPAQAASADASADQRTTMFGAVREETAGPGAGANAAERAERLTSAFFGASRRGADDDEDDEGAASTPSERPAGTPPADPEHAPADPENTRPAASRTAADEDADTSSGTRPTGVEDSAASPEGEPSGAGRATPSEAEGNGDGPKPAPARDAPPRDDEQTGAGGSEDGAHEARAADGGAVEASAETGSGQGPDQDTAMLRAPRPARKDAPTTAIRLPGEREGSTEDDSRFVPLRSLDEATPPGGPESGEAALAEGERTKQQPAPAPEPLDLLAQLTNTPPPPATPIRTTVRRFKIWTPLVVLLGIVVVVAQALRPLPEPELALTQAQTHTFDGAEPSLPWPGEGQAYVDVPGLGVLGEYGKAEPVPIGSVAKTMTAYLVLRKSPLKKGDDGPMITVDAKAEEGGTHGQGNGGESVLDTVHAGDRLSERDALSALMIPSANNIARLLARWYTGGSEAAFVEKMNATADALGMDHTTYTDPSGLKHSTVSTARDQVALGRQVVRMPELMKITSKPQWTDPSGKTWRNWNSLVPFNGAIGIKTGTTTAAGGNLLFAGRKNIGGTTQVIVGAVLGQHKPPIIDTVTGVSKKILVAAGDALQAETVVSKGQVVGYVDDRMGRRTPVVATKDVTAVGWAGLKVSLGLENGDNPIPHTARSGDTVGVLTVGDGPGQVRVPVALQRNLKEPGFGDKLTRVL